MESDLLSDREKAAVLWAEHVTLNTARSRPDVFEEVEKHFDAAEIVELTLMSGLFAMFNRLMDSLSIPIEIPKEVDKIQRSLTLDPDKVLTYFETVAETWPETFPDIPQ
jgi:hypothetical protein